MNVAEFTALMAQARALDEEIAAIRKERGGYGGWFGEDAQGRIELIETSASILRKRADKILADAIAEPKLPSAAITPPVPNNLASLVGDFSDIKALRTDAEMAAVQATYQRRSEETVESVAARIVASGADLDQFRA